ncbi:MAG: SpoIIIAH-like family protein [Clostridia bacterium]|nr:SpoIIIAH-like family protein [Clostridia bacterium]
MTKRKKIIVLSCMIALLAVTAVFNFVLTTEPISSTETNASANSSYFTQYRLERLNTRNENLLQIDEVLQSAPSDSEEYSSALALKTEIAQNTERELLLENLIKAYGFEDVVVVIGLESDSVNVIAKSSEMTTDEAIVIYSIISEEINIAPENVKIIPIS